MAERQDDMLHDLEHYALKGMEYGELTGLSIACHAIQDGFLLMHVGVGCKNKAVAHLMSHDAIEDANLREGWTEVGDRDLILGASDRAAPYLRSWYSRQSPAVIFVTSATFIDLAGEDLQDKLRQASQDIPVPVIYVGTPGYRGDLYSGYARVMESIIKRLDWSQSIEEPSQVSLLGYLFDRYERDHSANIGHLGKLLRSVGLTLGPSLFEGKPFEELATIPQSGVLVDMPYTRPRRKAIRKALGEREVLETDLPMGLRGTSRWLRALSEYAGVWTPLTQARITRMEEQTRKRIAVMFDRWRGMRVAVFADPAHGAGLLSILLEIGLEPVLVGLKGSTMGDESHVYDCLEKDGNLLPENTRIFSNPSISLIQDQLKELLGEGKLDGVFGSAVDLNALSALPPESFAGQSQSPQGPFMVETGFPCRDYHALYPMPFMGYRGVEVWVQRILSAPRLWDAGRKPHLPNF